MRRQPARIAESKTVLKAGGAMGVMVPEASRALTPHGAPCAATSADTEHFGLFVRPRQQTDPRHSPPEENAINILQSCPLDAPALTPRQQENHDSPPRSPYLALVRWFAGV